MRNIFFILPLLILWSNSSIASQSVTNDALFYYETETSSSQFYFWSGSANVAPSDNLTLSIISASIIPEKLECPSNIFIYYDYNGSRSVVSASFNQKNSLDCIYRISAKIPCSTDGSNCTNFSLRFSSSKMRMGSIYNGINMFRGSANIPTTTGLNIYYFNLPVKKQVSLPSPLMVCNNNVVINTDKVGTTQSYLICNVSTKPSDGIGVKIEADDTYLQFVDKSGNKLSVNSFSYPDEIRVYPKGNFPVGSLTIPVNIRIIYQ
ncbi:TPA: hypothetical protein ACGQAU_004192 [Escherichia coli]